MRPALSSKLLSKKTDNMPVRVAYFCVSCLNPTTYTLEDVWPKARRASYGLCFAVSILFFGLLTVRQYDCYAALETSSQIDLSAIASIESSGNPSAINRADNGGIGSYGLHQLSPYAIADFNKRHKTSFKPSDCLKAATSTRIANWYVNEEIPRLIAYYAKKNHKIVDSVETRLTAYNMGIGAVVKGKTAKLYISKYRRLSHVESINTF